MAECDKIRDELQEYREFDQQKLAEKKEELDSITKEIENVENEYER